LPRIQHALRQLYIAKAGLVLNNNNNTNNNQQQHDDNLLADFDTQIHRLRVKLQKIGGADALRASDDMARCLGTCLSVAPGLRLL
jgi:hypothetical protein